MPSFRIENERLYWGDAHVRCSNVTGFHERMGPWSAKVWLEIKGVNWKVPIGEGYGENRKWLRQRFPQLPFDSDWMDGRFQGMTLGLPPLLSFSVTVLLTLFVLMGVGALLGYDGALLFGLASVWPLGHIRSQLVVQKEGMRAGPSWRALIPWHQCEKVSMTIGSTSAIVYVKGVHSGGSCVIPKVLIPAVRARLWRLGGLSLSEESDYISERYLRWAGPSWGLPWGVLLGVGLAVWFTNYPWTLLTIGVIFSTALGLLGAAVRSRAFGWAGGGVFWLVILYALGLTTLSLVLGEWIVLP